MRECGLFWWPKYRRAASLCRFSGRKQRDQSRCRRIGQHGGSIATWSRSAVGVCSWRLQSPKSPARRRHVEPRCAKQLCRSDDDADDENGAVQMACFFTSLAGDQGTSAHLRHRANHPSSALLSVAHQVGLDNPPDSRVQKACPKPPRNRDVGLSGLTCKQSRGVDEVCVLGL